MLTPQCRYDGLHSKISTNIFAKSINRLYRPFNRFDTNFVVRSAFCLKMGVSLGVLLLIFAQFLSSEYSLDVGNIEKQLEDRSREYHGCGSNILRSPFIQFWHRFQWYTVCDIVNLPTVSSHYTHFLQRFRLCKYSWTRCRTRSFDVFRVSQSVILNKFILR